MKAGLLFTYLMAYGGSLAALFSPFTGLLIFIGFSILKPDYLWAYHGLWAFPHSRIIGVGLLVGWGLHNFGQWNFGRGRAILFLFIGFWLWSIASMMNSVHQEVGWAFVESIGKILVPFLVGMTLIDSNAKLKQIAWVMVLSLGYVAFEYNWYYYSGFNYMRSAGFGGMDNNSTAIQMVSGAGLALFLALGAKKWWQKGLGVLLALLMAHSVLFAFSRGGMLALLVTTFLGFFLLPKKPQHYLVFIFVLLVVFRLAGNEVTERFLTIFVEGENRDGSAQSRLDLWANCLDAMLNNPILGVGPNHWPLVAPNYGWDEGKEAHSLWMQTGAELGFPGLLLLGLFYGLCIIRLWPLARSRLGEYDPWHQDIARMVIASLAGFGVSAQFVSLENLQFPYYVVLLGAGMLKQVSAQQSQNKKVEVLV